MLLCCLQVGVIYDIPLKELRLFTDYGRASRPIFVVDNQRLLIKKSDIMKLQVGQLGMAWFVWAVSLPWLALVVGS